MRPAGPVIRIFSSCSIALPLASSACSPERHVVAMSARAAPPSTSAILASLDGLLRALELSPAGDDRFVAPAGARPLHPCVRRPDARPGAPRGRRDRRRTRPATWPPFAARVLRAGGRRRPGASRSPWSVCATAARWPRAAAPSRRATGTLLVALASFHDNPDEPELVRATAGGARTAPAAAAAGLARRPPARARGPRARLGRPSATARPAHRRGADVPRRHARPTARVRTGCACRATSATTRSSTRCCSRTRPTTCSSTWRSARIPDEMPPGGFAAVSVDHALWFHRPVRFDRWHLHTQETVALAGPPRSGARRGARRRRPPGRDRDAGGPRAAVR